MSRVLFAACTLVFFLSCGENIKCPDSDPLIGAWSVESIRWIYPDTAYHLRNPEPGFLHFTSNRYSFIWTPSEEKRTAFKVLSQPTPEEMQAGFRSIVLNAGSYSKTNSTISIVAEVAKVPGFEGGSQLFEYSLAGDTLTYTMVDETYPDGTKPSWFGKLKTEFILSRILE